MRIDLEPLELIYEIYVGNNRVKREQMIAPFMFYQSQFASLVQQIANEQTTMMLRVFYIDDIWDQFEQKHKQLENGIEFKNNPMVTYHEH